MTTTIMKDSIVGDQWIQATAQAVPVQRIIDAKTGQPKGDILTGPVRLAFDALFELPQQRQGMSTPKYGATLLFTPYADFKVLYEDYYAICAQMFSEYYDPAQNQYVGLHSPFHDQREKTKFGGFTPGLVYMTCTSKYKPPVVDARFNPIVDRSKVYPGVWAICALNAYGYGKNPPQPKKGVAFGLQSVMIIGDDTKFGGGAPDPTQQFKGVSVAAPIVRPDIARGMPSGTQPPAPAGIPGYTQPGFQQGYAPPAAGPSMNAGAPPLPSGPNPSGYATPAYPSNPPPMSVDDDAELRAMGF